MTDQRAALGTTLALEHEGEVTLERASGDSGAFVLLSDRYVYRLLQDSGEAAKISTVLSILHGSAFSSPHKALVPQVIVVAENYQDSGLTAVVETRLAGDHPQDLPSSGPLFEQLLAFFVELAGLNCGEFYDEFEGERVTWSTLKQSLTPNVKKFRDKIINAVGPEPLADLACDYVASNALTVGQPSRWALAHKDLHPGNLLVGEDGRMTGLIDWGAALHGPWEWELAVLKQRAPVLAEAVTLGVGGANTDLVKLFEVYQAMRFWKSFPTDLKFVTELKQNLNRSLLD